MSTKELKVAALKDGTVIDHLPADQVFNVVALLGLEKYDGQLTIGNNLESKALGKKGIIKISDRVLEESEANKIALVAPHARINIIRNYEVVDKRDLSLPDEIHEIVRCSNPKCITNNQPVATRFHVLHEDGLVMLRCHYCEREIKREEVKIQ